MEVRPQFANELMHWCKTLEGKSMHTINKRGSRKHQSSTERKRRQKRRQKAQEAEEERKLRLSRDLEIKSVALAKKGAAIAVISAMGVKVIPTIAFEQALIAGQTAWVEKIKGQWWDPRPGKMLPAVIKLAGLRADAYVAHPQFWGSSILFPRDILVSIFTYLTLSDQLALALTCVDFFRASRTVMAEEAPLSCSVVLDFFGINEVVTNLTATPFLGFSIQEVLRGTHGDDFVAEFDAQCKKQWLFDSNETMPQSLSHRLFIQENQNAHHDEETSPPTRNEAEEEDSDVPDSWEMLVSDDEEKNESAQSRSSSSAMASSSSAFSAFASPNPSTSGENDAGSRAAAASGGADDGTSSAALFPSYFSGTFGSGSGPVPLVMDAWRPCDGVPLGKKSRTMVRKWRAAEEREVDNDKKPGRW